MAESAYPYVLAHGATREPLGEQKIVGRGLTAPVLAGAVTELPNGDKLNSVVAVSPDGHLSPSYDKIHLLWFGEEVPLAGVFPWIRRTFARGLGMVPGDAQRVFDISRVHAAALVCFEDTLPEAGREAAHVDPNLLVDVSNDAWFTGSSESELHLRLSVLRAIETRRDLVRAVNGGETSLRRRDGPRPQPLRRPGPRLPRRRRGAPRRLDPLHRARRLAALAPVRRRRVRVRATKRRRAPSRSPTPAVVTPGSRRAPQLTGRGP